MNMQTFKKISPINLIRYTSKNVLNSNFSSNYSFLFSITKRSIQLAIVNHMKMSCKLATSILVHSNSAVFICYTILFIFAGNNLFTVLCVEPRKNQFLILYSIRPLYTLCTFARNGFYLSS